VQRLQRATLRSSRQPQPKLPTLQKWRFIKKHFSLLLHLTRGDGFLFINPSFMGDLCIIGLSYYICYKNIFSLQKEIILEV
jgi:hypothetical protein